MRRCGSAIFMNVSWAIALGAIAATPASAHFLFIRILPPAEGGRAAEVYFSERAEAGDPRFIEKVAATKLWIQESPGTFHELPTQKAADRLRAHLPIDGAVSVIGRWDYGVLARPMQKPFLLRHYPKAVAGPAAELARLQPRPEIPLEIVATFEPDRVVFSALRNGKPLPKAAFDTVDLNLAGGRIEADAKGRAEFKPDGPGTYSIYTQFVDPTPGEQQGKHYDEIREFATLSFTWPLVRTGSDPAAVKLFQDALAARATWKKFPGFRAKIKGAVDDRAFEGSVKVAADGGVALETDQEVVDDWVRGQLESLAMHRIADDGATGDTPVLRFADQQSDHPLGRLLEFEGGQFASSYRVRDGQITVVNRNFGGRSMTITTLENTMTSEGRYLPRSYTVQYWEEPSGKLSQTETVQDRWQRVGAFDLPAHKRVIISTDAGLAVREFTLSDWKLAD
jgi:Protein of unknown function (DUF3386)